MKKRNFRILSIVLAAALTAALVIPAVADTGVHEITVAGSPTVHVDGKLAQPKTANGDAIETFLLNGTTYYPLRALSEYFGAQVGFSEEHYAAYVDTLPVDDKASEYLKEYFDIEPMTGSVSEETLNNALTAIWGEEASLAEGTTVGEAVKATVENCGLKELAPLYSAELATATTEGVYGIADGLTSYVAAALDASLASGTWNYAAELDGETAAQLLMNAVNISGKGRNYLGNVSDTDIAAKMRAAFGAFYDFHDLNNDAIATLWKLGETIVDRKATTGFGLCSSDYDARFLNEYTVQYSHHSIDNAVQLVTVMANMGINAKVALEPKVSIYQWDGHLNAGMEYNLRFEFNTVEEKNAFFDNTIQYTLRVDNERTGNIIDSYWTPCYNSYSQTTDFEHVYDNVITCGKYSLHPFSLPENVDSVSAVVNEAAEEFNANAADGSELISTQIKDLWCDTGFYQYLVELATDAE